MKLFKTIFIVSDGGKNEKKAAIVQAKNSIKAQEMIRAFYGKKVNFDCFFTEEIESNQPIMFIINN